MSILAFYLRFLPKQPYHCYIYGAMAIMAALAISVSVVSVFLTPDLFTASIIFPSFSKSFRQALSASALAGYDAESPLIRFWRDCGIKRKSGSNSGSRLLIQSGVSTSQASVMSCDPPSAAWDPMQGTCTRTNAVVQNVVVNVFHLVTDLFLLLLPLPVVLRLRTDMKKKRKLATSSLAPPACLYSNSCSTIKHHVGHSFGTLCLSLSRSSNLFRVLSA